MLKKTAIAIDPELLHQIDAVAEERGQSRNAFIASVLEKAVKARRDWAITQQLNTLFAEAAIRESQSSDATALDHAGDSWSDERW